MQSTSAPQVFLFGQKAHPSLFQGLFSMQMGVGGFEERRPILTNGLSTLVWHVSRRPEEQRASFNLLKPRGFFLSLASRHSTYGLHTSAERKITNPSA